MMYSVRCSLQAEYDEGLKERGSVWRKDTARRQRGTTYLINYHQSAPEKRKEQLQRLTPGRDHCLSPPTKN